MAGFAKSSYLTPPRAIEDTLGARREPRMMPN